MKQPSPAASRSERSNEEQRVLITGAGGEIGHGLIAALAEQSYVSTIALDLRELDSDLASQCHATVVGDITDMDVLRAVFEEHTPTHVYHLAALLSTSGEKMPEKAHAVNVTGTLNLLRLCAEQLQAGGPRVTFLFPSSIAVYGLPDLDTKAQAGPVKEDQFTTPITMYGCNKLYCEQLGRYFAKHYMQLASDRAHDVVDFRAVRYPGIISAHTVPSGGTSDFGPEMLHAAAQGKPYTCFVREDARIPFMTMPDAIDALLALAGADRESLSQTVYNLGAFNPSAGEFAARVRRHFPDAAISYQPTPARQAIVDSWPADVDDSAARNDWGYAPKHDLNQAFEQYLVPNIRARYEAAKA